MEAPEVPDGYELWFNELDGYLLISKEGLEAMDKAQKEHDDRMQEIYDNDPDNDAWMFVTDDEI